METGGSSGSKDPYIGKTLLGKLKVIRRLGKGGMGAVYEVEHLKTRHHRALKVLLPSSVNPEVVARFEREATVAGMLKSPYVVEVLDAGHLVDGLTYLLMELLEGEPLSKVLEDSKRLAPARAARIIAQACEGVFAAHEYRDEQIEGIIHRDLKPDNLFLQTAPDGSETVKLLDFGISKFRDAQNLKGGTAEKAVFGTPYYMSPEQVRSSTDVDQRSDVYALGVVLYEMLTGELPYTAQSPPQVLFRILSGQHKPVSEFGLSIPSELAAVVERAMHSDPKQRFQSARELQQALLPFCPVVRPSVEPRPVRNLANAATIPSEPPSVRRRSAEPSSGEGGTLRMQGGQSAGPSSTDMTLSGTRPPHQFLSRRRAVGGSILVILLLGIILYRAFPRTEESEAAAATAAGSAPVPAAGPAPMKQSPAPLATYVQPAPSVASTSQASAKAGSTAPQPRRNLGRTTTHPITATGHPVAPIATASSSAKSAPPASDVPKRSPSEAAGLDSSNPYEQPGPKSP